MNRAELFKQQEHTITTERKVWEQRFVTAANVPDGHAAGWIHEGVKRGMTEDSHEGRVILANHMGGVFSHFFEENTGGEKFKEDVNPGNIALEMELEEGYVQEITSLLVDTGVIKSRDKIHERNSRYSR